MFSNIGKKMMVLAKVLFWVEEAGVVAFFCFLTFLSNRFAQWKASLLRNSVIIEIIGSIDSEAPVVTEAASASSSGMSFGSVLTALFICVVLAILVWVVNWYLYALGQRTDDIHAMRGNLEK